MPLSRIYKFTCSNCKYKTIKTLGDADMELLFVKCLKCGSTMKKEPIAKKYNILDKTFKK